MNQSSQQINILTWWNVVDRQIEHASSSHTASMIKNQTFLLTDILQYLPHCMSLPIQLHKEKKNTLVKNTYINFWFLVLSHHHLQVLFFFCSSSIFLVHCTVGKYCSSPAYIEIICSMLTVQFQYTSNSHFFTMTTFAAPNNYHYLLNCLLFSWFIGSHII